MALSRSEREKIKFEIQQENILLQRVKRYVQYGGVIVLFCVAMLVLFLKGDWNIWKILDVFLIVVASIFTIMSFLSYRNGRKHVLQRINYLDQKK